MGGRRMSDSQEGNGLSRIELGAVWLGAVLSVGAILSGVWDVSAKVTDLSHSVEDSQKGVAKVQAVLQDRAIIITEHQKMLADNAMRIEENRREILLLKALGFVELVYSEPSHIILEGKDGKRYKVEYVVSP